MDVSEDHRRQCLMRNASESNEIVEEKENLIIVDFALLSSGRE